MNELLVLSNLKLVHGTVCSVVLQVVHYNISPLQKYLHKNYVSFAIFQRERQQRLLFRVGTFWVISCAVLKPTILKFAHPRENF